MPLTKIIIPITLLAVNLPAGQSIVPSAHTPHLSDKVSDYRDYCPRFICNDPETEAQSFSRYLSD